MPTSDINLADRSGNLVEAHKNWDPRIVFFYFALAAMLAVLAAGLAYQQLSKSLEHNLAERQQNTRRILYPGPRGNIYARDGATLLVGNSPRWAVVLHLDELRHDLLKERSRIRDNFAAAAANAKEIPSREQLEQLARVSLVQHYLDQVNAILGRTEGVDPAAVKRHFSRQLLLPFTLLDDLNAEEYAKLIERLPVNSPLEVYAMNTRYYPFGSAAAHTLGYVRPYEDIEAEDFPGDDLTTFKMRGTVGKDGLEKTFDDLLQGQPGGRIYRVDPSGFKIDPPLDQLSPKKGRNLVCSLDVDLQVAAEEAIGDQMGAAVALDVRTGEVLVLASKPDFDLSKFSPRATPEIIQQMNETGAWRNNAIAAAWHPGSTFKILSAIAGLRRGLITIDQPIIDCEAWYKVGNHLFPCYNGHGRHGEVLLSEAIGHSCDIYFYRVGELTTPDGLAAEARRFHLDRPTGIELPNETRSMLIPDPDWKQRKLGERWYPGDTANISIGQGAVLVSPLGMACFIASVARGETVTIPTLVHDEHRAPQHSEPIGLSREQLAAIFEGMVGCTTYGTGKTLQKEPYRIPGINIAGKTGTAQEKVVKEGHLGTINYAWFVCFAPVENPEIALAVAVQGDEIGEEFAGGEHAAPIASVILRKYFEKKTRPAASITPPRIGE